MGMPVHRYERRLELFEKLKESLLSLYPNTTERILKHYIAFVDEETNGSFAEVVGQKRGLKLYLRPEISKLKSAGLKLSDCSKVGHWTNGNTSVSLSGEADLIGALDLIRQAHEMLRKGG